MLCICCDRDVPDSCCDVDEPHPKILPLSVTGLPLIKMISNDREQIDVVPKGISLLQKEIKEKKKESQKNDEKKRNTLSDCV